jgi:hypothetical protein
MARFIKKYGAAGAALVSAGMASAQSAVPAAVQTKITESGDMLVEAGTAVIVALVGFWAIRALGKKMGWWA